MRAQQDHVAGAEGFSVVAERLQTLLLFIQLGLQRGFFIFGKPFRLGRFILHQHPPAECPDHCWHPFDDKHFAPAEGLDQVARHNRHPQYRDRVTEDQEGIRARAFRFGKPVADVDQHRRHDRRLNDAQDKANGGQGRNIVHHAGQ